MESIVANEEDHVDWLEAQLDQIEQIGIENYLTEQVKVYTSSTELVYRVLGSYNLAQHSMAEGDR